MARGRPGRPFRERTRVASGRRTEPPLTGAIIPTMAAGNATPRLPIGALERRLFVDAPPSAVWLALHDPAPGAAVDIILALDPAGPDWPAAGARRTGRLRLGPLPLSTRLESLEARPGRLFRVGIVGSSIVGERRWELAPAAGGTRVACAMHLEGTSRIGRAILRLERGALGPRLEAELAALKRAAESPSRPGP